MPHEKWVQSWSSMWPESWPGKIFATTYDLLQSLQEPYVCTWLLKKNTCNRLSGVRYTQICNHRKEQHIVLIHDPKKKKVRPPSFFGGPVPCAPGNWKKVVYLGNLWRYDKFKARNGFPTLRLPQTHTDNIIEGFLGRQKNINFLSVWPPVATFSSKCN